MPPTYVIWEGFKAIGMGWWWASEQNIGWSGLGDGWIPMVLKTFAHNFLFLLTIAFLKIVAHHFLFKKLLFTISFLKTCCSPLLAACLLGPDVPLCCPLNEVWPFVKEVGLRFFINFFLILFNLCNWTGCGHCKIRQSTEIAFFVLRFF